MCNTFTFHGKFGEMLKDLDNRADQDALIIAMVRYGSFGEETVLEKPFLRTLLNLVKHDIDASVKNSNNGKRGRQKRDEAEGESPLDKPPKVAPSDSPQNKPTGNRPPPPAKKEINKERRKESNKEERTRGNAGDVPYLGAKTFCPPSLEEAQAFCAKECLEYIDAERLWSYYESQDWVKSHGLKITDWQAAFREANERESKS